MTGVVSLAEAFAALADFITGPGVARSIREVGIVRDGAGWALKIVPVRYWAAPERIAGVPVIVEHDF